MTDPLELLWPLVDAPNTMIAADLVAFWPSGLHQRLLELGVLRQAGNAERILCPECRNHVEEVVALPGAGGQTRYAIACPEAMRVIVPPAILQQWIVDAGQLAIALATTLRLTGQPKELSPDRLWRLGRWTCQGVLRDVLFARGLRRNDALQFRRAITSAHRPVVFVGSEVPDADFWQGRIPPLIRLREVARLVDGKIEIDLTQVIGLVRAADEDSGDGGPITLDQLKLMIRQQIKAEGKTALTDDILLEAYRQCGTVREAADFLTEQTGQAVSKDKVQRAVTRGGGPEAVMRGEDSESIVRSVSSQRRDTPIEKRDSNK